MHFIYNLPWWLAFIPFILGCIAACLPVGLALAQAGDDLERAQAVRRVYGDRLGAAINLERVRDMMDENVEAQPWLAITFWGGVAMVLISMAFWLAKVYHHYHP